MKKRLEFLSWYATNRESKEELNQLSGALGCMGDRSWLFECGLVMLRYMNQTSKFKGCFTAAKSKVETFCAHFLKCSSCFTQCLRWIVVCIFASLSSNRSRKFLLQSNSGRNSLMMAATRVSIQLSGDRSTDLPRGPGLVIATPGVTTRCHCTL